MVKYISYVLLDIFFCLSGFFCGNFLWHQWHYCLEIKVLRVPFYFHFAQNLQKEMQKLGYLFSCPTFLPKTTIQFIQINKSSFSDSAPQERKFQTNIAILGDCFDSFNFNSLDNYDLLIPINEDHYGYLSQFNYKLAYFPLPHSNQKILCETDFNENKFDVASYANFLNFIIQGMYHEKL